MVTENLDTTYLQLLYYVFLDTHKYPRILCSSYLNIKNSVRTAIVFLCYHTEIVSSNYHLDRLPVPGGNYRPVALTEIQVHIILLPTHFFSMRVKNETSFLGNFMPTTCETFMFH